MVNGDGVDENDYDDYEYEDHNDDVVKGRKWEQQLNKIIFGQ